MKKIDISVIIPMYNAEKYMVSCIKQLLAQSSEELALEVIVVDDCSKDGSVAVVSEAFAEDKRVRLFKQEKNGGPGAARNRGIREAKGEYITFLDSDDGLRSGAYEQMLKTARRYSADVVHVTGGLMPVVDDIPDDINRLTEDEVYHFTMDEGDGKPEGLITEDIAERLSLWLSHRFHWAIWNKLYRREFIREKELAFSDMKLAEDQVFCFNCLMNAENYAVLPGEWYIYRIGGDSLCRGKKTPEFMVKVLESMAGVQKALQDGTKQLDFFAENDILRDISSFVIEGLIQGFALPTLRDVGKEELQKNRMVNEAFDRLFGENANLLRKLFYDAQVQIPEGETFFEMTNHPAFWKALKEKKEC